MPYLAFTHTNVFNGLIDSDLQREITILVNINNGTIENMKLYP